MMPGLTRKEGKKWQLSGQGDYVGADIWPPFTWWISTVH